MSPSQKMKERPKNSSKTSPEGLSEIQKNPKKIKSKLTPFSKLHQDLKIRRILELFCPNKLRIDQAMKGKKLKENEIENKPECFSTAILEEEVNLLIIKSYVSKKAWASINQTFETKKKIEFWPCETCKHDLELFVSIRCDLCLAWNHQECASLKRKPKAKNWFCAKCKALD